VPCALYAKNAGINLTSGEGIVVKDQMISAKPNSPIWNSNSIQNEKVSGLKPNVGDVLVYDGMQWTPSNQKCVPAGTGILSFNSKAPEGFKYSGSSIVTNKLSGAWNEVAPMDISRRFSATCEYNGKLYVFGGEDEQVHCSTHAHVYDPVTNKWTNLNPMPVGRVSSAAVELNGLIYISGGILSSENYGSKRVDVYNPSTNTWSAHEPMNNGRFAHSLFSFNNKLFAVGGTLQASTTIVSQTIEEYDFDLKKWTVLYTIPNFYHSTTSTILNGVIYFVNGYNDANDLRTYSYSLITKEWEAYDELNTPRANMAMGTIGGYIVVAGGRDLERNPLDCTEIFSTESQSWMPTEALLKEASYGLRGVEVNGKFIVVGGQGGLGFKFYTTQCLTLQEVQQKVFLHNSK